MEALELFKKLPHLDYNKNVITDWGYTPNLYHFDGSWCVSWIHCEEGDSFIDFEAETPEEAIKKAFDWCVELKLIEKMNAEIDLVNEFVLPEDYIFKDENGNVINATKIVVEKNKKEYPKTYEECAKVLLDRASVRNDFGYKGELLVALQKLLVCRDAYWKIAGEEMGLGKPWKPNWEENYEKSVITTFRNAIAKFNTKEQYTFAFPTVEMRNAFYENFKELIEQCKELL